MLTLPAAFSEQPCSQQSAAERMLVCLPSLPDVSWFKGHQSMSTQRGVTVSADGRVLRIERAQLSDAGSYRCVATNVAGSTGLQYGLRVNGECPGPLGLFQNAYFLSICLVSVSCLLVFQFIYPFIHLSITHLSIHPSICSSTRHTPIFTFTHHHLYIHPLAHISIQPIHRPI